MSDETNAPRKGFGYLAIFVTLVLGLVIGGVATTAAAMHHMHGWGGHGGGHRGMDGKHAQEHVQRMVGFLAWKVDATAEQKQKLTAIAEKMAKEIEPVHQKIFAAHKRAHELLLQPTTDRAALETLRAEQIVLADDVSKKLVQALADAADVLTPDQRTKLAADWDF